MPDRMPHVQESARGIVSQEHPWCPRCGVLDGPLAGANCGVCLDEDGETEAVEFFVVAADFRMVIGENERLRAFAFGDTPEWEKANATLKHRVRELEAEVAELRGQD